MKKVMSFLVVSGLCANGSCFGMDWDLAKSKAAAIAKKARKNRTVRKINRKVRKIKKVVKNNRKIQAVLGASTAVAGSALAYRYLEAAKNLTVNVPVSKISGNSVGFLTKALNLTKSYPVATGLTTIGGLAGIAAAMTYFMKSEAIENKVEDQPNNNNSNGEGNPEQPKQEDVKDQPGSEATEDGSNDSNSGGAIPVVTNPENQEQIEVNNILQNHQNLDKQIVQISNDLRSGKTIDSSVIGSLKNQVESERTKINNKISKLRESNSPEATSNSNDISDSIKILENKMLLITILTKIYEVTQSFNNDNLDVDAYKKLVDDLKNLRVDALKIYNSKDPENILTLFKDGKSLISSVLNAAESASDAAYDRFNQNIGGNHFPIENLISNEDTTVLIDSEDENTVSDRQYYISEYDRFNQNNGDTTVLIDSEDENTVSDLQDCTSEIDPTIQSSPDENNMYASENNESQKGVNQEASLSNDVPIENLISNGDTTVLIDSIEENIPTENWISDGDTTVSSDSEDENTVSDLQDCTSEIDPTIQSHPDENNMYASENNESQKGVNQEDSPSNDVPIENLISNGDTTVLIDSIEENPTPIENKINQTIQSYKNEYADPGTSNTNTNSSDYSSVIHAWLSFFEKLTASENPKPVVLPLDLEEEKIPPFILSNDVPRLKLPIELPKDLLYEIPLSVTSNVNTKLLTYDESSRASNSENEESRHRERSLSEPIFGSGNNGKPNIIPNTNTKLLTHSSLINAWPIPVEKLIASKNAITTNTNKSKISKRARKRQRSKENKKILKHILDVIQKPENLFKDWTTLEEEGKFNQIREDYNLSKNSERWKDLVQKALEMRYSSNAVCL